MLYASESQLWDHSAFKHLVGDWRRNFIDKRSAHLWIIAQQLDHSLLLWTLRFIVPGREFRTRRLLVSLYHSVRNHIHDRELLLSPRDLNAE
jgi:hypothetical protein